MAPTAFRQIAQALLRGDPPGQNALRRWRAGNGLPTTDKVPIRDLVLASRGPSYEWHSYAAIIDWLADLGWRPLPPEPRLALKRLRGTLAFDPDNERGLRPDILLCRPRFRRLLVVEVKRAAIPTQGYRNPSDQVADYARACRRALPRNWSVEPLLVAEEFSPVVLDEARATRLPRGIAPIACRSWDGTRLSPNLLSKRR